MNTLIMKKHVLQEPECICLYNRKPNEETYYSE